jgi:hypothetical protein
VTSVTTLNTDSSCSSSLKRVHATLPEFLVHQLLFLCVAALPRRVEASRGALACPALRSNDGGSGRAARRRDARVRAACSACSCATQTFE